MRCGGEKIIYSFLFGANPAGRRRQGAPPPAPLPKGLRPFGIPLMQRITCAAEGKMDFRFYPGQIPPDDGGICCFLARLGADSCRGRRRVAHDAGLGWGKGMMRGVIPALIPCTSPLLPRLLRILRPHPANPPLSGGICPEQKRKPIIPIPAAHKMRRQSGILKGLRPLSWGFQGGQRPPWRLSESSNFLQQIPPPSGGICPW